MFVVPHPTRTHRYTSAESDCSLALTLDDRYLKAYLRRGTARLKLGRVDEARDDFTAALRLERGNKIARSELDKLNKVLCVCNYLRERFFYSPPSYINLVYTTSFRHTVVIEH